jgi:D-amino-acid dehydrogenase
MAEFAAPDAPQGEKQPEIMLDVAAKMMGRTPSVKSTWVGSRPSTPDSLPVIGRVPGHPNFMLAFGHGHLGLTLAATTGKLVAESIQGTQQDALLAPFSPSRFH